MHFPLRPGVEVIMSFIEGDPDRPIIVGSLYNTAQPSVVTSANLDHAVIRTGPGVQMKFKGGH
jgi:type VI secretion system secreted protein VgrG